jgi:hypothetical protein
MSRVVEDKIRVAYVSLFGLTEPFLRVRKQLQEKADAFFITSTQQCYRECLSAGVAPDQVLNVSRSRAQVRRMGPLPLNLDARIAEFEQFGPSFSSIILMSRFYAGEDSAALMHYMVSIAMEMEEFFLRHRIGMVIAEPTNAVELLATVVSRKLGIRFGNIGFARLPHNRLVMFQDTEESAFLPLAGADKQSEEETLAAACIWLDAFRAAPSRPAYFASQAVRRSLFSLTSAAWRKLNLLIGGFTGANEINNHRFSDLLRLNARPYFAWLKRFVIFTQKGIAWHGDRPYVVYFLHVSPERSVDVVAPWFSNQIEVIRTIRRALPSRYDLLVKEHPSSTGAQSLRFYWELGRIPNLFLLPAAIDSRSLMRKASFVTTISGTSAFEAALLHTPALIFSNVFFRQLPLVLRCTSPERLAEIMGQALQIDRNMDSGAEAAFLAGIMANSVGSAWDGSGGNLPVEIIDSFASLILKTAAHQSASDMLTSPQSRMK